MRADRTLLEAILFNATQNAALHGAAQHPIAVRCSIKRRAPSAQPVETETRDPNLEAVEPLLRRRRHDLFEADERRDLRSAGVGNRESTFPPPTEAAAGALHPPATLRLRVLAKCDSSSCAPSRRRRRAADADADAPDPAAAFGTLEGGVARRASHERTSNTSSASAYTEPARPTEGLTFVVADDDDIARVVASQLIERCMATARLIVVGESRDEVAALPARVAALGREIGGRPGAHSWRHELPGRRRPRHRPLPRAAAAGWRGVLLIQSANTRRRRVLPRGGRRRHAGQVGELGRRPCPPRGAAPRAHTVGVRPISLRLHSHLHIYGPSCPLACRVRSALCLLLRSVRNRKTCYSSFPSIRFIDAR